MAQETWPLCDRAPCHICKLYTRLVNEGASPHSGTSISEGDCCIQVSFEREYQCQKLLRLDEERAKYRLHRLRAGGTEQTKMCDFAIFARQEENSIIVVAEIKNTAKCYAIEQLQAGLDIIYKYLSPPKVRVEPRPKAFVVANRQTQQLMKLLILKKSRLRFGTLKVQPRVKKCGDELRV